MAEGGGDRLLAVYGATSNQEALEWPVQYSKPQPASQDGSNQAPNHRQGTRPQIVAGSQRFTQAIVSIPSQHRVQVPGRTACLIHGGY